jgi:hypothetical protein
VSSTNRGAERAADDFYETPAWATRAILPHLPPLPGLRILEPSAGRGAIVRELLMAGAIDAGANRFQTPGLAAIEMNKDFAPGLTALCSVACRDYLTMPAIDIEYYGGPFDLIVMNPPFAGAQGHVEKACGMLAPGGCVAALLRLAFVASAKRAPFRAAHPFDLYPLASRPSFTPDGKTDSADYAWYVFGVGRGGRFAVLEGNGR